MTKYVNIKVNITEGQKQKLLSAIDKGGCKTSIRLSHKDLNGNDVLAVTQSQARKIAKAFEKGKGVRIRMSASQLKHNTKIKENPLTWKIFSQEEITLALRQVFPMQLGLGFTLTKGVVLTSLAYSLRFKNCSLQNEITLEDVDNILITMTNNSKDSIKIKENELLCRVYYHL